MLYVNTVTMTEATTRNMVKMRYLARSGTTILVGGMISASSRKNTVILKCECALHYRKPVLNCFKPCVNGDYNVVVYRILLLVGFKINQ